MALDRHRVAAAIAVAGHGIGALRVRVTLQFLKLVTCITGNAVFTTWILFIGRRGDVCRVRAVIGCVCKYDVSEGG